MGRVGSETFSFLRQSGGKRDIVGGPAGSGWGEGSADLRSAPAPGPTVMGGSGPGPGSGPRSAALRGVASCTPWDIWGGRAGFRAQSALHLGSGYHLLAVSKPGPAIWWPWDWTRCVPEHHVLLVQSGDGGERSLPGRTLKDSSHCAQARGGTEPSLQSSRKPGSFLRRPPVCTYGLPALTRFSLGLPVPQHEPAGGRDRLLLPAAFLGWMQAWAYRG